MVSSSTHQVKFPASHFTSKKKPRSGCECYAAAALPWELSVATTGGDALVFSNFHWDFRTKSGWECGIFATKLWLVAGSLGNLWIPNSNFHSGTWSPKNTCFLAEMGSKASHPHRLKFVEFGLKPNWKCWRNFKKEFQSFRNTKKKSPDFFCVVFVGCILWIGEGVGFLPS